MKNILITGTSRGLGESLAKHYCKNSVVFGVSRSPAKFEHKNYQHIQLDLSSPNAVSHLHETIKKSTNHLDVLINNAAFARMNLLITNSTDDLKNMFDLNFFVPYELIQMSARLMIRQNQGRIINVGSIAERDLLAGESAYAATKAALRNLTQIAAKELGHFGVTVNMVSPGPFDSTLTAGLPAETINKLIEQQAIKQKAELSDLIHVFDFFMSPNARMITGQTIYLGGP